MSSLVETSNRPNSSPSNGNVSSSENMAEFTQYEKSSLPFAILEDQRFVRTCLAESAIDRIHSDCIAVVNYITFAVKSIKYLANFITTTFR